MLIKTITTYLIFVFLTGCATLYQYKPNQGEKTATLNLDKKGFEVNLSETGKCPKSYVEKTTNNVTIPVGKRFWVDVGYSSLGAPMGRECIISLSFMPQDGKTYAVDFKTNPSSCSGGILTNDGNGNWVIETSTKQEEFNRCW